ncbi:MAG: hypothetical protein ACPGN3_17860, partial [Opitutales bacterium]
WCTFTRKLLVHFNRKPTPEGYFLPINISVKEGKSDINHTEYNIHFDSKAFDLKALLETKNWLIRNESNNQGVLYFKVRNDARVTFSLFDFYPFYEQAAEIENWEDSYLKGLSDPAFRKDHEKVFPVMGSFSQPLMSQSSRAIINYARMDRETKQWYFCRDHFIDFEVSENEIYTLLVQFQRPYDIGPEAFKDVFKLLYSVESLVPPKS